MRIIYSIIFLISFSYSFSQTGNELMDSLVKPDPKYREDQFYAGLTYNLLQSKPSGFSQNSFSTGLNFGFLRDMPVNKARTYSIAAGIGYSYNNMKHNLKVHNVNNVITYGVVPKRDIDNNKLVLHYIDFPIEFRWRNSDSISHKFWRIYTGVKLSYLVSSKSQFESGDTGKITIRNNSDINNFTYGAYISAGYNTWNIYAYYGLTPIFKSAFLPNGEKIKLNSVNLGLMFYIL